MLHGPIAAQNNEKGSCLELKISIGKATSSKQYVLTHHLSQKNSQNKEWALDTFALYCACVGIW